MQKVKAASDIADEVYSIWYAKDTGRTKKTRGTPIISRILTCFAPGIQLKACVLSENDCNNNAPCGVINKGKAANLD